MAECPVHFRLHKLQDTKMKYMTLGNVAQASNQAKRDV